MRNLPVVSINRVCTQPVPRPVSSTDTQHTLVRWLPRSPITFCQATFCFFHWIKGSPDEFTQGEWNGLTWWEQLDAGLPWTPTKKFLMLVPALLCLPPLLASGYAPAYVACNLPIFLVLETAKMPSMHRVRIMSINATAGIDDLMKKSD
jgi:ORMDL family